MPRHIISVLSLYAFIIVVLTTQPNAFSQAHRQLSEARHRPGQSTPSRIERAYASGDLTIDQWALYHAYAMFEPEKLPSQFRSDIPEKCGTWILHELLLQFHGLSPQTQEALAVYGIGTDGMGNAHPTLYYVVGTTHFLIHYSVDAADTNAVSGYDGNANGIPDYVDTVMTVAEQVWATEIDAMSYTPPPPDSVDGGDSRYDIYISRLAPNLYGFAQAYKRIGDNPSSPSVTEFDAYRSYLALRNDYSAFGSSPLASLEVTVAHEFFHAIQYGYNTWEKSWMMEATAAWIEDEVYNSVNDNYQYLDEWFQRPDVPLDAANRTADTLISYADHWYGSWIYFRYLAEHVGIGPQIVLLAWDFSASHESRTADRSMQSIAEALAAVGGRPLNRVFDSFAAANLLVKSNGYGYSEGASYPAIARTPIVRDITIIDALPRRSSRYYTFGKSQLPSCDEVFSITFTSLDPATSFELESVAYSGGSPGVERMGNVFTVSTPQPWDSLAVIVMNLDSTGSSNGYQMVVEHHPKVGRYTITDIGKVGMEGPTLAINQSGQVAGTQYVFNGSFVSNYAFRWSNDQLSHLGGDGSTALGINDSGTVVGMVKVLEGVHAYRWSSAGGEDLDKTIYSFSRAWSVNDSGDVVGDANFLVNGSQFVMAALWKRGQMTALPFPQDTLAIRGVARSINNNGVVAGEVLFHKAGDPSTIGAISGIVWSAGSPEELDGKFIPQQINGHENMAGSAEYHYIDNGIPFGTGHAALYLGASLDLGTLGNLFGQSVAYGINSSEDVVGASSSVGGAFGAFLFKNGTMVDLNREVRDITGVDCWTLNSATGINDAGQIVGYGVKNAAPLDIHAFLLTPVGAAAIQQVSPPLPVVFALEQNYPNPFNPTTGIRFQVSGVSDVRLAVYDVLGREVAVLVNERKGPGKYEVKFDGTGLSSGVYFYRLTAGSNVESRKMILMK